MSPYGVATLINSITRMINNFADQKAWRERKYGSKDEDPAGKTQAMINAGLGVLATGGAVMAAVSDNDEVKSVGIYTTIVSGTILTATNVTKIL